MSARQITWQIPEELYGELMKVKESSALPNLAAVIQQAVQYWLQECILPSYQQNSTVEWLTASTNHAVADPLDKFIGAFSGGGLNWVDNHDLYLGKTVMETGTSVETEERGDA